MKNKTKYLVVTLFMLVSFLLIGATNVSAETTTADVDNNSDLVEKMNDKTTDIVRLNKDIELSSEYNTTFSIEKSKTLDLNGHTITVPDGREINFWYYADADIKIMNSSNSSSAKIIGNHTGASTYFLLRGAIIRDAEKVNFEIDGVDFEVKNNNFTTVVNMKDGQKYENLIIKNSNVNGNQYLFWGGSAKKVYLESITLKGADRNLYRQLSNTSSLTVNDVIDANAVIEYYPSAGVKATADRTAILNTSNLNAYWGPITVKFANGFNVSNASLTGKYGETPETNITIKNIGENDLQIKNVTVSEPGKFEIKGGTQPTVSAGATNTDFKVKAKAGLDVGDYTATITVTDMGGKTYTATVTLKVEKKNLTVGISGLDSTWAYGTDKTPPTATGVDGLGTGDYKITYSKLNNGSYEDIGTTLPKLVGKYKATLSINNSNYTASDASVNFEITPIDTEVKVKSYDAEFTYDGTEHSKNAYDVLWANNASPVTDNKLPNGDLVTAVVTGKVRDVKDTALENNTIGKITITNADGIDVTDCYSNIVKAAGKLTVNPITTPIVVTAGSDTKVYDGTELTKNTYTYTDGVLLSGDMLEATITGSQKFVGSSNNAVSNVKVMRSGEDITSNYTMGTHINGVLEVTSASQPLAIADQYVKVNGSIALSDLEQEVTGNVGNIDFTIKSGTALTYDAINDEYVAGATEGDVVMTVTAVKVNLGGDDTPEWKETTKDFTVHVVNKENVTITGLEDNQVFTFDNTTKTPWGTGTITVEDNKVDVNELEIFYNGTGSTTYSSKFAPVDAGTYTITYKVKDSNPNYVGSVTYAFTIKKAQLNKPTASTTSFVYDGTSKGYSSFHDNETFEFTGTNKATNVGNYSITISLKDKDNYEWKDGTTTDVVINWSITQATPDYTVPTGLTSVKGKVLADVALPTGFTWNAPATVLTVGKIKYKATFTPVDTTNYKTITDIDIEVDVKNTFNVITSVPGENGTITPSKIGVIEGSKVKITFTPNTGYMVDKVLVNGIEKTANGNEIEITVDEEKTVEVSYKKIPFTITVEEVTGATVDPDGTVTVSYGDNKDFTITANTGYKLVKVLVNDEEKALDGNTLKLKNITSNMKIKAVVEKIEYKVIEGADQTYTIDQSTEARFRINADYSLFDKKVYVDDILVDGANYTSESGSTIITFSKEYIDTLAIGQHTLKVAFTDGGEAKTTFTIARQFEENNNNENVSLNTENKEEMKDNGSNPKTGDNVMLYIAIVSMSIIGLGATTVAAKKNKTN